MKYKVKAFYSRKMIGKVTFQYLIKAMGLSFYIAMLLSTAIALYLFLTGNRTLLLAIFSAVSVFGILIFLRMYSHYFSGANREFKKIEGDSTWLTIRENGISLNNESDSLKWKDLFKVWKNKDAYLFFTTKDSFIICPIQGFDEEVIQFIDSKLDEFRITTQ